MVQEKTWKLTNCAVTKIFEGPRGTKGNRDWMILKVYFDHPKAIDREFTKFVNPNEPETFPYVGLKCDEVVFSMKQSGDFTNYKIESIKESPGQQRSSKAPVPTPDPSKPTYPREVSMCVAYVKDIVVAQIRAGTWTQEPELVDIVDIIARQGVILYHDIQKRVVQGEDVDPFA